MNQQLEDSDHYKQLVAAGKKKQAVEEALSFITTLKIPKDWDKSPGQLLLESAGLWDQLNNRAPTNFHWLKAFVLRDVKVWKAVKTFCHAYLDATLPNPSLNAAIREAQALKLQDQKQKDTADKIRKLAVR